MKNIIFDLGGVILKDSPIIVINDVPSDMYNQLKVFFDDWTDLDLGNMILLDKFNECNFSFDIQEKYKDRLVNYYLYRALNVELLDKMKVLRNNGYKVYVLSDNNIDASRYYKENFKDVDGWVMSCDYHTKKRDGKLFDILLDKFNLKGEECYFIDDRKANIDEALKHNIKGFVFSDNESLYEDMKNNGIDIGDNYE